jgi:hypothetical protein
MPVKRGTVSDDQPAVSSSLEDQFPSKVSRLSETPEPDPDGFQVIPSFLFPPLVLHLHGFQSTGLLCGGLVRRGFYVGDESPDDGGTGEEDGGEEGRVIISEFRDQSGGSERSGRSRDFVKDVNHRVHSPQLSGRVERVNAD